jgi:hypothetical protein
MSTAGVGEKVQRHAQDEGVSACILMRHHTPAALATVMTQVVMC